MFYAKKLDLSPAVKGTLFNRARETRARGIQFLPKLEDAFYWSIGADNEHNIQQYAFMGPYPLMEPLNIDYFSVASDKFFKDFRLAPYQGSVNDANWAVHKHVFNLNCRYSLTLIDDEKSAGSVARFWNVKDRRLKRPPSDKYRLDNLDNDYPMELVHEEPIEPFEAYLISTWQWHSYVTPDSNGVNPGFSSTRVISYLLIPNNCSTDDDIRNYADWMESL